MTFLQKNDPFLPRDALQSIVQYLDCMSSVSVRLSVTLVDQDHTGWKSWKLIARSNSPTPSLIVAQRPSTIPPTPRGTWGNFGETRGGVGKSGVLEHKSGSICEMREDRGKVTMKGL